MRHFFAVEGNGPHAVLGSAGSVSKHPEGCETLWERCCPLGRPSVNVRLCHRFTPGQNHIFFTADHLPQNWPRPLRSLLSHQPSPCHLSLCPHISSFVLSRPPAWQLQPTLCFISKTSSLQCSSDLPFFFTSFPCSSLLWDPRYLKFCTFFIFALISCP